MLARERQNTIVEIVNREGSVRVKNLSKKFGVTEDSIRKDLAHLEKRRNVKEDLRWGSKSQDKQS